MKPYRRYPSDPPSHGSVWLLIVLVLAVLLANLAHQATGIL